MSVTSRLNLDDFITRALRIINDEIGNDVPTERELAIIAGVKAMREPDLPRVDRIERVDYLLQAQKAVRAKWSATHPDTATGVFHDAVAGVDTPIGRLRVVTWRREWAGRRGERVAWSSEYYLNDEPITVGEIRRAGLAMRPTTRKRRR